MDDVKALPLDFELIDADSRLYKGIIPTTKTLIGIFEQDAMGNFIQKADDEMVTYMNVQMTVITLRMILIYQG